APNDTVKRTVGVRTCHRWPEPALARLITSLRSRRCPWAPSTGCLAGLTVRSLAMLRGSIPRPPSGGRSGFHDGPDIVVLSDPDIARAETSEASAGHGDNVFERERFGIRFGSRHEELCPEQTIGFAAGRVYAARLHCPKASFELVLVAETALDESGSGQLFGHHAALGKGGNELVVRKHPQDERNDPRLHWKRIENPFVGPMGDVADRTGREQHIRRAHDCSLLGL